MRDTIQVAIQHFGNELQNITATEKDYLQAVRSYNTTESDAEILVKFRERVNKLLRK